MDDTIYRQAAIDAVYERIKQIGFEDNAGVLSIRQAVREVPPVQQWVSVRDRLPEINKPVLVWVYDEYYLSELHSIDGILYWDFDQFELSGNEFDDVVAWMPLPEPYKGDLKNG